MSGNCFEGSAHILTKNEVDKILEVQKENDFEAKNYSRIIKLI